MKKRLTALMLTLAMCLSFLCVPALAANTAAVSGTYDAGVVTVTGTGFTPTLKYSVIAVKDSGDNLIAIGGATADGSGNLSASITTGAIADVTGYTVYVYNDNGGDIAAQGAVSLPVETYTATVTVNKDGAAWNPGAPTITLEAADGSTSANGASLANGTYKILADGTDTGETITVDGATATATLDYYTVTFAVTQTGAVGSTIAATYDGAAIGTGDPVLGGKTLVITATGAGAETYTYAWTGDGTSGETTAALTIDPLTGTVNASCAVKGLSKAPAPTTAEFEASTMTLSGVTADMSYSVDGGATWKAIAGTTADLSAETLSTANGIQVRANGDGATTGPSDPQAIALTQAAKPTGVGKTDETAANAKDGTLTGVSTAMEYRLASSATWTAITGTSVTNLAPGAYEVRTKGAGTVLASETVSLTIAAYGAPIVTYTITFNANGGTVTPATGVTGADGKLSSLPTPTRSGYTFDGWFTLASGGNRVTTSTVFTANDTIYAHWTSNGGGGGGTGGGSSGGGGGSSSSGGSVSGSGSNVSVSAGSGGSVSDTTLKSAASKATEGSAISISASGSASATLPVSGLTAVAGNDNSVSLTLKNGAITLSASAIEGLVDGKASGNVTVSIQPKTSSTNSTVKELISAGAKVFDVSVAVGSTAVHSFDGSLTITLTVSGLSSMKNPVVVHVMDNGEQETYTPTISGSKLTISGVRSLSSFAVIEADKVPNGEEPKPETPTVSFTDVPSGAYYADAVAWAVERGITSGTSSTTFAPDASCTRAQVVTFLWRANGSPVTSGGGSFSDVSSSDYYAQAVAWAVSEGITSGTGTDTFSPDAVCTRAQVVTFLHRAEGSPAASGSGFADVDSGAFYADAVAWAVQNGVTSGTSATTFAPNTTCTRAQVVTFLYRALAE